MFEENISRTIKDVDVDVVEEQETRWGKGMYTSVVYTKE